MFMLIYTLLTDFWHGINSLQLCFKSPFIKAVKNLGLSFSKQCVIWTQYKENSKFHISKMVTYLSKDKNMNMN